eukprot:79043-Rhodomonas_salina.2
MSTLATALLLTLRCSGNAHNQPAAAAITACHYESKSHTTAVYHVGCARWLRTQTSLAWINTKYSVF